MATAPPSPNDLTRQQLDELDALLQRMLSVPLTPPDTPMPVGAGRAATADAPPLPPSWRIDPPAPPASASTPHIALPDPPSAVALKFEPPAPPASAPALAPKSAVKVAPAAPPPVPAPAPVAKATPVPKPVVTVVPAAPVPTAPPVPLPLLPLVALNSLFDATCGLFGPLGRVLRSGFLKNIYGLIGIGLIVYTLAHIAQAMGWVTLPITVPWPR